MTSPFTPLLIEDPPRTISIATFSGMASDNHVRYYARARSNAWQEEEWQPARVQSITAFVVGYFVMTGVTPLANTIIDRILLFNFPRLARDWCFVGPGRKATPLHRVQAACRYGALTAAVLMRWPGWYVHGRHLWECVRITVAIYTLIQFSFVGLLLFILAFVRIGDSVARTLGWEPEAAKDFRSNGAPHTPEVKFNGPNMPRKHPSSVEMGRFLYDLGHRQWRAIKGEKLFVAVEKDGQSQVTIVYQSITAQEKFWDTSFEELRLSWYEEQEAKRSIHESSLRKTWGVDKGGLPSWLSTRSFRDSVFGSSVGSGTSQRDRGSPLFDAADKTDNADGCSTTPDLLTGSPLKRRRFA